MAITFVRRIGTAAALGLICAPCAALAFPKPKYAVSRDDVEVAATAHAPQVGPAASASLAVEPPSHPLPAPIQTDAVVSAALAPARSASVAPVRTDPATEVARSHESPRGRASPQEAMPGYRVVAGDTLSGLGRRFGVSPQTVSALNALPTPALKVGALLSLPAEARDRGLDPHARGDFVFRPLRAASLRPAPRLQPGLAPIHQEPVPGPTPRREPAAQAPLAQVASSNPAQVGEFPDEARLRTLARGRFVWPVRGDVISRYGVMGQGLRNDGVNIGAGEGAGVRAAAAGAVVFAGTLPDFGKLILIKHADGWVTAYGHLEVIDVRMRDKVNQGQEIGRVGRTGAVDKAQLHFEIRYSPGEREKARPVDPTLLLP